MKIKRFAYENKRLGWKLNPVELTDFNLLVGASGAGKSQILDALRDIQSIADGPSVGGLNAQGICWDTTLSIAENSYRWCGEISNSPENHFKSEMLIKDGDTLIQRTAKELTFQKEVIGVTLSPTQSCLKLFASEAEITPIYEGFQKILYRPSPLTTQEKMLLCKNDLPEFHQLKDDFKAIFPQVADMVVEAITHAIQQPEIEIVIRLKIHGVEHWIDEQQISSGMLKTLMLLSDLYLSPNETILLIDEFENSLGVNCMNIIEDLITPTKNWQVIITSHHPYIINHVPMAEWKIVTRHGGTVTVREAHEFWRLSAKKLDSFTQLINLPDMWF